MNSAEALFLVCSQGQVHSSAVSVLYGVVRAICGRVISSFDTLSISADDLAQEVFVRLLLMVKRTEHAPSVKAVFQAHLDGLPEADKRCVHLLHRMIRNLCLTYHRRSDRQGRALGDLGLFSSGVVDGGPEAVLLLLDNEREWERICSVVQRAIELILEARRPVDRKYLQANWGMALALHEGKTAEELMLCEGKSPEERKRLLGKFYTGQKRLRHALLEACELPALSMYDREDVRQFIFCIRRR
jgi:DNA-directed RNA polymerase specialized sigma24 family protein